MELSMENSGSDNDLGSQLKGDIIIPDLAENDNESSSPGADFNTLDEPVLDTITRDLKAVGKKIGSALAPSANNVIMKEWDLWGPLLMCTYIGLILQGIGGDGSGSQFTQLFVMFWVGVSLITYNFVFITSSKILDSCFGVICIIQVSDAEKSIRIIEIYDNRGSDESSIFQCICVLGYCLGPLAIAATVFESMHLLKVSSGTLFLRFIISSCGAAWSAVAATRILVNTAAPEKKYIALGPVIVFYVLISLLILLHSAS